MTETLAPFPHPATGEPLETLSDFQNALTEIEILMSPWYRIRRELREEMTERFQATLPQNPRNRTITQAMVARCPRCQKEIEVED